MLKPRWEMKLENPLGVFFSNFMCVCLRLSLLALGSALTYRLDNQLVGDELQCGAIPARYILPMLVCSPG